MELIQHLRKILFPVSWPNTSSFLISSLIITSLIHLFTQIPSTTAASGDIGSYCESYKDCSQSKLLECNTIINTCACSRALQSEYSAVQGKCVRRVGQPCIIHQKKFGGPLPDVGCVDNAKCEREPYSRRAIDQGLCTCSLGYYRTVDSFCHPNPSITGSSVDGSSSSSSSSNKQYGSSSLDNVVNSMPTSQNQKGSSRSDKNPEPYHHPLTRSAGISTTTISVSYSQAFLLSLISFVAVFLLNS